MKPGGFGAGADDHKLLYNYKILKGSLITAGFKVELAEYWDENKTFHFNDWSDEDGHVHRSKNNDPRNKDGDLKYTSLIVDGIKL